MQIPCLSPPISKSHALPCDFEALYRTASRVRSALPRRLAIPRRYRTASQFRGALPRCPAIPKHSTVPLCRLLLIFTPPFLLLPSVLALFLGLSRFGQQHEFYGIVINPGVKGPFEYGYQNQPACCDMSALVTMSTSFIRRAPHRKRVDNDSSGFYFRAPGTSRISRPF